MKKNDLQAWVSLSPERKMVGLRSPAAGKAMITDITTGCLSDPEGAEARRPVVPLWLRPLSDQMDIDAG
jgi:hypothetical protein